MGLSRATWRKLGGIALIILVGLVYLWTADGSGSPSDSPGPSSSARPSASVSTTTSPRPAQTSAADATPTRPGSRQSTDPVSGLPWIAVASLPSQAREVLADIDAGGPFAYPGKDGSTFGNFEGVLPAHKRGYYREYTVPTPGASTRGARRIVTGSAGEFYWTADHYASFSRIKR